MKTWCWVLVLVLCTGCLGRAARLSARMEGRYELTLPTKDWVGVDPGGADKAWRNEGLGATLYADSNCGKRYEDIPLPRLLQHQLAGIPIEKRVYEDVANIDGRESFTVRIEGRLDGVRVGMSLTVIKKGDCVYDFVAVGPPNQFDDIFRDYEAAVSTFRAES
ncbi:MAG: hypothetical protein VX519_00785 [Myxococcota bacterium]|nr:hypothetical protein [Myxococcota bacterium]